MEYVITSHRHATTIFKEPEFELDWLSLLNSIESISEEDLIDRYPISKNKMSLSSAINDLIKERLINDDWLEEVPLFSEESYKSNDAKRWRIDFARNTLAVEVAFNHGEAMAWNLLKPVMSSELNHVNKAVQTLGGVIILATEELKSSGAFDGAVGTYEKALRYLKPMNNFLTVPLAVIGLKAPNSFRIDKIKEGTRNVGRIRKI